MYTCSKCGKPTSRLYPGVTCQGCYNYFRLGGTENPRPDPGVIAYDDRGCVICHICGRAYKRLGSHIRESHDMTTAEYKEAFGLCASSRTTEAAYSRHMHDLAYRYDMPNRLIETGRATRIRKGDRSMRLGKKTRLQESLDKRNRRRANTKGD